jgi:hypothetical protein
MILNRYGLCSCASYIKIEFWGVIWSPQKSRSGALFLAYCGCTITLWVLYSI